MQTSPRSHRTPHRTALVATAVAAMLLVATRAAVAQPGTSASSRSAGIADGRVDRCVTVGVGRQADTSRSAINHATMDHSAMGHAAPDAAAPASAVARCGTSDAAGAGPTMAGQAAYAAITEVVALLDADSSTDWSRVNLEALRLHLADMDRVTLQSRVTQHAIAGGMEADVTGDSSTAESIRRMVPGHARMLAAGGEFVTGVETIPGGVRLRVTSRMPGDSARVARIRGLGFAGLLTEGNHHARHHLALARGTDAPHEH